MADDREEEKEDLTPSTDNSKVDIPGVLITQSPDQVDKKKFENRRRMAWWSMKALIFTTVFIILFQLSFILIFLYFPEKTVLLLAQYKVILDWSSTLLTWLFSAYVAIIASYMGFTTYAYGKMANLKDGSNG